MANPNKLIAWFEEKIKENEALLKRLAAREEKGDKTKKKQKSDRG